MTLGEPLVDLDIYLQVFVLDPDSPFGVSSTNGLYVRVSHERGLAPPKDRPDEGR